MIIDRDRIREQGGKERGARSRRRAVTRKVALERLEDRALLATVPGSSFLTGPNAGQPLDIALGYLARNASNYGIGVNDLSRVLITNQYTDTNPTVTHIYLRQSLNGLPVDGSNLNVNIAGDGSVINVGGGFSPSIGAIPNGQDPVAPMLTAWDALSAASRALDLPGASTATLVSPAAGDRLRTVYSAPGMSLDAIPVQLQYVRTNDGSARLAWELIVRTPNEPHWYDLSLDATSGTILRQYDWVDAASYNVYAPPVRSPNDGPRTIVTDPQLLNASPYGWHDTDGSPGPEYTITRGNNVYASEDRAGNFTPGASPDGGSGLNFNFPINLNQDPSAYTSAATVQLFYTSNTYHDILYQYGFTEAAGNFQENNYGRGGVGGDPVVALAQQGAGIPENQGGPRNNAFFATPPDGQSGLCVMYVWSTSFIGVTPDRDGDLDNEIMLHEMTHGLSNRLTGGPADAGALNNLQSAALGEGWSDFVSVVMTMKPTDTSTTPRYIGNYATALFNNSKGVRRFPYSYDMTVNPLTLGDFRPDFNPPGNPMSPDGTESHNGGEIWAQVLQDMTWNLIAKHGYDPNLSAGYTGSGTAGNILALKLVVDAMKLQPANPTYLQARDAILLADRNLTGGANSFSIWNAFARRGFGVNASDDGNSDDYNIQEDFTVPPSLQIVNTPFQFVATEGVPLVNVQVAQLVDQAGRQDAGNYHVSINWGDGSPLTTGTLVLDASNALAYRVFGSHKYDHAGTYTLTISANSVTTTEDEVGTRPLTVLDQPLSFGPVVTISGSETTPFVGKLASFVDANPSAIADPAGYLARFPYTVSVTWGDDGTQTSGIVRPGTAGGFDVMVDPISPHLFFRGGVFQITVTITDVTQSVTIVTTATIARAPLSAAVAAIPPNPSDSLTEGGTFTGIVGTIRGPLRSQRAGDFQVVIDWGDGSTPTPNATVTTAYDPVAGANYFVVSGSHQYRIASTPVMAPLGYYPVTFLVTDYDGTQASPPSPSPVVVNMAPITLTVKPPTVNVGGVPQPLSLVDGQSFTETIASFIDTNRFTTPSDYVARIDWGDGSSSTGTVKRGRFGVGSFDVVGTHAYAYWNYGKYDYQVTIFRTEEYNRYQSIIQATPASPIAAPVRAQGVASFVVKDAPIAAQGVQATGVEGVLTQLQVATFHVNSPNVIASQYTAQINWGDGSTTAGVVGVGAATGDFVVYGTHAYPFGTYSAQVSITSRNGSTATAASTFTITDGPSIVTTAPVSAIEGVATSPTTIATFANPNTFAGVGRYKATINWGDGSTNSGVVSGNAANGYSVLAPSHVYLNPGNFTVTVTIAQTTGRIDSAANTAFVAVRVEPITGSLAPGIDSGVVSTAAISRNTQPTIIGKARAYSTVELFAQAAGQSTPTLLGTTVADASGNYTVLSSVVLAEGSYTLTVDARNALNQVVGQITPILGSKPYIVDLTPPSVASSALQASRGRFVVTFADNVALNPNSLLNLANYAVSSATTGASIRVTSVAFDPTAVSTNASRTVIVTLANGKRLGQGSYLLNIRSAGTTDAAGNTLVEKRFTIPPINSLTPPPDYFAMYKVGNPNSVKPQTYISPVSVNGAQAYLLFLRSRPRAAARRG